MLRNFFERLISEYVYRHENSMLERTERLITASVLHQHAFSEFKGCNTGKDVVLIGAGPSVKDFKPIPDCVYVGLNSACKLKNVNFDYLFAIDKVGIDKIYSEFASVPCVKFVGDQNRGAKYQIPESEIQKMGDVRRYITDVNIYGNSRCALHLESQPLGNYNSVSLQAMQFILYTNPRRIFLVGIDCSSLGHFDNSQGTAEELRKRVKDRDESLDEWAKITIQAWKEIKEFADIYYPDTEIVSVNPVGLKGFFKDMYQE